MRLTKTLTAVLALLAVAACGDGATAPTDRDLLGTWTISAAPSPLSGGSVQEMTVRFAPGGVYTVETATYGGVQTPESLQSYGKSEGSVSARRGQLTFFPRSAMSFDLHSAAGPFQPPINPSGWDQSHPLSYQVVGNQLVLHLPAVSPTNVLVLTRR